jgi:hypothetical protein
VTLKIAHILPVTLLDELVTEDDKFHLCLSNLVLANDEYRDFYKMRIALGDYVIVDTPAFETGQPASPEDVIIAAAHINPSEVILPDAYKNASLTVELSLKTARRLRAEGYQGKLMFVPHGRDAKEYIDCARELTMALRDNFVIGVIEEIPELYGVSRRRLIRELNRQVPGPFHLLGADNELRDLTDFDHSRYNVRSCDTSKLVVWGLNGIHIDPADVGTPTALGTPYPGRDSVGGRDKFFTYQLPEDEDVAESLLSYVRKNIENWREI